MHRTFDPTPTRWRRELDGPWDFLTDPPEGGAEAGYVESFPDDADRMAVPGTWNVRPSYHDHEGVAWYHRRFEVPATGVARLTFHGVCHDATVWLDGDRVASHYGGYTPFEIQDTLAAGEHDLVVRTDNTRDERSIPRPGTDWFPYGGITREVVLELVPERFVEDLVVEYTIGDGAREVPAEDARVHATVEVVVRNVGESVERTVGTNVAGTDARRTVDLPTGTTTVTFDVQPTVDLWSPEDPDLYDVIGHVETADGRDEYRDRVGFRSIAVTDTDVLINGEATPLRGVNRHEDHPEWGHAQPHRLQEHDLDVIEDAGCNTIRTAHYPNHPRFLDCCDERGILVIEEIPYWQFDAERFAREGVLDRGLATLEDLIERDRHHPSIVAWSVSNECENDEQGVYDATKRLVETARAHDDRPVTLASNQYHSSGGQDPCLDLVDVACINAYPGWYGDGSWAETLQHARADNPEKPIVVSEFGAGAVANERTHENQKWSEGYQANFLAETIETFKNADAVAGFTVWQYCDTRTDPREWATRPKTKNNKGIVDEYRRPKQAYHAVRDALGE
jgi:beta-glucuronidase